MRLNGLIAVIVSASISTAPLIAEASVYTEPPSSKAESTSSVESTPWNAAADTESDIILVSKTPRRHKKGPGGRTPVPKVPKMAKIIGHPSQKFGTGSTKGIAVRQQNGAMANALRNSHPGMSRRGARKMARKMRKKAGNN